MRKSVAIFGLLTAALLAGKFTVGAEGRYVLPPETAKLKAGPGMELANQQCLVCHSADYISTQPRLSRTAWRASVQKMKDKYGAPIPTDKMDALAEYLAKNYGAEIPKP